MRENLGIYFIFTLKLNIKGCMGMKIRQIKNDFIACIMNTYMITQNVELNGLKEMKHSQG
jgi:hypothetical protein